jgi:hypothetical protein
VRSTTTLQTGQRLRLRTRDPHLAWEQIEGNARVLDRGMNFNGDSN